VILVEGVSDQIAVETLASFRALQHQRQWHGRPVQKQLRRFLASGATRKLRYAEALVLAAASLGCVPEPLQGALGAAGFRRRQHGDARGVEPVGRQ
jgi:hypothetical protein